MNVGFEYHTPSQMSEVSALLAEYGADASILAGGTDLIPKMKAGVRTPGHVISLKAVEAQDYIEYGECGLSIGPKATLWQIEQSDAVRQSSPALYEAVRSMASTQIRNFATLVGNICNAVPSADTAPALLVYGAEVRICGSSGSRVCPIGTFFTGVCRTVCAPDEYVAEIRLPVPSGDAFGRYAKYTVRRALELAMVGVAVYAEVKNGVAEDIRIALGAVAPTPIRARYAEDLLIGNALTDEAICAAADAAAWQDASPISDIRASAGYRREIVRLLVRDLLKAAREERGASS
ncbi:MAG: xanthine dehydrogenase family protein subunit M [Clostridiales Family XIII bacterium]|nr:xanthine dehydrogenase family protein subunit M [Clostridiales Family XIII bacterium]